MQSLTKLFETNQLCYEKGSHKKETGAFDIRPALGPSNKDKCLADNTHLKVDSCCKLRIISSDRSYSKFVLPNFSISIFAIGMILQ